MMFFFFAMFLWQGAVADSILQGRLVDSVGEVNDYSSYVIYWQLKENPVKSKVKSVSKTHSMVQRDKIFVPSFLAARVGDKVEFPNQDDVFHNVFSLDPIARFDLGVFKKDQAYNDDLKTKVEGSKLKQVTFNKAGKINVFCNLHEEMNAVVLVFFHDYFFQVKTDGSFQLKTPDKIIPGMELYVDGPGLASPVALDASAVKRNSVVSIELKKMAQGLSHKNKLGEDYKKPGWKLEDEDIY